MESLTLDHSALVDNMFGQLKLCQIKVRFHIQDIYDIAISEYTASEILYFQHTVVRGFDDIRLEIQSRKFLRRSNLNEIRGRVVMCIFNFHFQVVTDNIVGIDAITSISLLL